MKYTELEKLYLCGIGSYNEITDYRVGTYDPKREGFKFHNGVDGAMELFRKPVGSNVTYVISAIPLSELDDKGLLMQGVSL